MDKVLITGCAGFIGFHVVQRLLRMGYEVLGLDNLNPFYNDGLKDANGKLLPLGWVDGNPGQMLNQLVGVAIAWGLAIVGTLIILKLVDMLLGVRVSAEQEIEGLDLSMHGEEGYNLEA